MNKYVLPTTLFAVAFIRAGFCQSPSETPAPSTAPSASATPSALPSASPGPTNCNRMSWSPESHTFYGKKEVIVDKLATLSPPSEHRVFLQITQGESEGNVRLYEKRQNGGYTVTEWSPHHTSELLVELDKTIMANKGVNCVGEQMKAVLKRLGKGKTHEDVAEPVSPEAAFAHPVKEARGDFIKTVIIYGC
jgi:hypothetical protein